MADWLSEEWAEAVAALAASLPPVAGGTGTVCCSVGLAARREVSWHWAYAEGVPGSGGAGKPAEADLALTIAAPDAAEVFSGRMEPSVAFMRGRLKATGDGSLLLGFLASTHDPAFETWRDRVAGVAPVPA